MDAALIFDAVKRLCDARLDLTFSVHTNPAWPAEGAPHMLTIRATINGYYHGESRMRPETVALADDPHRAVGRYVMDAVEGALSVWRRANMRIDPEK